jgi:sporulation integral membrane protein YtvI
LAQAKFSLEEFGLMAISRTIVRMAVLAISVAGILYFLWLVRSGLYPFVIAFFLAYLLNPAVSWLEHKGLKRIWAIFAVYLILFSIVIIGGSRLIPIVIRELESFGRDLPLMTAKGEELLQNLQWKYQNSALPYSLRIAMDNGLVTLQTQAQEYVIAMVDAIIDMLAHSIGLIISPVLAFYLLHDWREIGEEVRRLLPARLHQELGLLFRDLDKVLAGVIRGQLTVAVIVGVLLSGGLYFLGVRYAVIIGILAGMLDIIPYFGAIIGAAPAVTVALLESPWLALKVTILFFVIHQMEGTIIGPQILGDNIGLHPLSVIFFLFIGGELGGLIGMLLGVPLAALGKVLLRHLAKALI